MLSGDRHMSELSKKDIGYTNLYDITSSGMTEALKLNLQENNPYRLGKAVGVNNYALLSIDWENKSLHISFHDINGKVITEFPLISLEN